MKSTYKTICYCYMLFVFLLIIIAINVKGTIAGYGVKQAIQKGYTVIETGIDNSEFMDSNIKTIIKNLSPENE